MAVTTSERVEARPDAARTALGRAVDHLLARQDPDGWWKGELQTNVTMDAEDLLMRQFLGVRTAEQTEQTARWIRSQQRDDGSWATFYGGPADASTTTEAYVALRLAGDDPQLPHMARARAVILAHGGIDSTRVFTRFWLALFGVCEWHEVPALPPEMVFLPSWAPLNLYDFACWARQTVAPLTILSALRPRRELGVSLDELRVPRPVERAGERKRTWGLFRLLDRALHGYEHSPIKPGRRTALRVMAQWVVARQEADGSWGGIQPPWVYSLMALHAFGYPVDHPVIARGLEGWERFTIRADSPQGTTRRLEACQSPVWDTALAMIALADSGLPAEHPALRRAADWLLEEEIHERGDWSVRRSDCPPGGWAFEFDNDGYPDVDDTAEVILALQRTAASPPLEAAVHRGLEWVVRMQGRDGGWAAFDADNTRQLAHRLPFFDFGAVIDPPSADVTAHAAEMLAGQGYRTGPVRAGVRWLRDHQEADGSWFGRWGTNHVYGVGAVVPALVAAGLPPTDSSLVRAQQWLVEHQNGDGGWGEDIRSYGDPAWVGRGASTASQTAWALLALHALGRAGDRPAARAIAWLVRTQRPDGGWDEPEFTGTGFPGDFYINYHLYRQVFPISALARCLEGT